VEQTKRKILKFLKSSEKNQNFPGLVGFSDGGSKRENYSYKYLH
jgi:hypothetical protein